MRWVGATAILAGLLFPATGSALPVTAVSDTVYVSVHPSLLFSEVEVPALYAKVRDGGFDDQAYVFIRNRVANTYTGQSLTELLDDDYGLEQFLNLAVATYLESPYDENAREMGRQLTVFLADSFAVDTDAYASALRLRNLSLGYDFFLHDATEAERIRVRDEIESYLIYILTSLDYELWHHRPYVSNKTAMVAAALGLAGIAMQIELPPSLTSAAIAEADDFLQDWMDAHLEIDGCYREGLLYGLWSMRHLVYYFEARRRFDAVDYSQVDAIQRMAEWLVYEIDPRGVGHTNNLQDCTDFHRPLSRHTTYLDWAMLRWGSDLAGYLYLHGPGPFGIDMGDESDKAATALWGQPPTVIDPGLTLPPAKLWPGRGLYYYRNGWPFLFDSDDVVFSFYSGVFRGGHAQEDQNQFTLTGFGEKLVTDHGAGYPARESEAHNLVLIDGAGQHNAGSSIGTDGGIPNYIVGDYMDFIVGDATLAYTTYSPYNENGVPYPGINWSWGHKGANPVNFAYRKVVMVHEAETTPYVIVIDDIEKDGAVHEYEWRLHTAEENTIDDSANPVVFQGDEGAMDVYVVNPCFDSLATAVSYFDNGAEDDNSNVLSLTVDAINPRFVNVLLPRAALSAAPAIATTRSVSGTETVIEWGNGYTDVILTADNDCGAGAPSPPASPPPVSVTTDARYAVARMDASSVMRYLMVDGSTLWYGGLERCRILDGTATVSRSEDAIYIDRLTADFAIHCLQDLPVYFHDVSIPTVRVGDYLISAVTTGIEGDNVPARGVEVLAYPNPFNPAVRISIRVDAPVDAVAEVYDVAGRRVARVWNGRLRAGENALTWTAVDGSGQALASGVYFLRVRAGTEVTTTKLTILK